MCCCVTIVVWLSISGDMFIQYTVLHLIFFLIWTCMGMIRDNIWTLTSLKFTYMTHFWHSSVGVKVILPHLNKFHSYFRPYCSIVLGYTYSSSGSATHYIKSSFTNFTISLQIYEGDLVENGYFRGWKKEINNNNISTATSRHKLW